MLETLLGPASEGLGDAYSDVVRKMAEHMEAFQDANVEKKHECCERDHQESNRHGPHMKKRKKKKKKNKQRFHVHSGNGAPATARSG